MTRQEFDEMTECWEWYDYIEYCHDNGFDEFIGDIYSDDERDEWIEDRIREILRNEDWTYVRDEISNYDDPAGCERFWKLDSYYYDWELLCGNDLIEAIARLADEMDFEDDEEDDESEEIDEAPDNSIKEELSSSGILDSLFADTKNYKGTKIHIHIDMSPTPDRSPTSEAIDSEEEPDGISLGLIF